MLHKETSRRAQAARSLRPWLSISGALLLIGLAACGGRTTEGADGARGESDGEEREGGVREREATKVLTAAIVQREMQRTLETTCVLESELEVPLIPLGSGTVIELNAEEGDRVERGQILARLDDRQETMALRDAEIALQEAKQAQETLRVAVDEARTSVETAQVNLAQAERDLDRNERLVGNEGDSIGSVSITVYEASQLARDQAKQAFASAELAMERATLERTQSGTAVARAELARDQAELALEYMSIQAPFEGVIASRTIRIGDRVTGAEPAFVLTDPTSLRAVFQRPQRELAMFTSSEDLAITATAEAAAGETFNGVIQRVSPTVDSASGNFRVTARIDPGSSGNGNGGYHLLPGMLLRIAIVIDRHPDALVAPKRAVVREGEEAFVFRAEDGVARKLFIEEGFSDDDFVELIGVGDTQLSAGDEVVVVGARDLSDGDAIDTGDESLELDSDAGLASEAESSVDDDIESGTEVATESSSTDTNGG